MQMKKFTAFILLITVLLTSQTSLALNLTAKGVLLENFETGEVLYEKNADTPLVPASLTKVMTLFLIYEGLERNDFQKDTPIPVSENARLLSKSREATNIVLSAPSYTVDEFLKMITAVSACAACTAFAEYIAGSEYAFAQMMTKRASELGLSAYFEDASGLSDNNRITPRSMAALTRMFIQRFPDILSYTSQPAITIGNKTYDNTNLLLPGRKFFYSGADGFKTGTTSLAGKCLISTAEKDGERIISVNMKSSTNNSRYEDATKLLNYGFGQIEYLNYSVFSTDIKTFINNMQIPCCYYFGKKDALLITAENLNNYGFNTCYSPENHTLYIYESEEKEFLPMLCEEIPAGQKLYDIYKDFTPEIVLVNEQGEHKLNTVYSLNGQCLIDVDELKIYYPFVWDDAARTASFTIKKSQPVTQPMPESKPQPSSGFSLPTSANGL